MNDQQRRVTPFAAQRLGWLCAAAALLTVMSACAPLLPAERTPAELASASDPRWQARRQHLASQRQWHARGKVAYRLPDEAGSANLSWRQSDARSRLRLAGPLGVGGTEITNEGAWLRVRRDGVERRYPADAAPWLPGGALLPIPVDSVHFWLRGVPDPAVPVQHLTLEAGRALGFSQSGWSIRYDAYAVTQGLEMPTRLSLHAPAAQLTVRVMLRQWTLEAPPEAL